MIDGNTHRANNLTENEIQPLISTVPINEKLFF
uniref:Uncharacterized protein n=1 Tax=Arundo donax TaxID=35708 RepID=A0A0A8YNB8_ARUDO